ncbi:MAG: NAD(P) transhydrogenase subunit alpha [Marinimicrobia bacterium 46_47]|nr:MAG: NAD(P) transhydrogenase subunit alpha [Marinimicrobia bacterium 46_47]KUK92286.1 MAG: NAD(P) transhydrogenase subunit alpha [Marinimicrobia bacterium 46_43]
MMIIGVLKEPAGETRIALLPEHVQKLLDSGKHEVLVEKGFGESLFLSDGEYEKAGAKVADRDTLLKKTSVCVRINPPDSELIQKIPQGSVWISYLDPVNRKKTIEALAQKGVKALSLEFIPRSTYAQKMDALSSQASLAGYEAVILAAERLNKIFPMMMTPAGTIQPARVFVIGAGVAGLQAIATAKRLGARVEAFDTRPVVEEEVRSLGAKFVKIDLGETGQTKDGYAKELTEEQLEKQRQLMAKHCTLSDVVITTAQVFGRKAPLIVTREIIEKMKKGSVIVDLAVESGGNVEGSKPGEDVIINDVMIVGVRNVPGRVAVDASRMLSGNLTALLTHLMDSETGDLKALSDDEIFQSICLTRDGEVIHETLKKMWSK